MGLAPLTAVLLLWAVGAGADPARAARISGQATADFRAREAQSWLQLEQDDRRAAERSSPVTGAPPSLRVEPLAPGRIDLAPKAEARGEPGTELMPALSGQDLDARNRLEETLQRQRGELDAFERTERRNAALGVAVPAAEGRAGALRMRQARELEALRFQRSQKRP